MGWLADRENKYGQPVARARLKRRGYPIHAYVGPNGTGKSAVMVYDTLPSLDHGRPVLSTVRLLDFRNPRPCDDQLCPDPLGHAAGHLAAHPLYVPFRSYQQLLDWRDGDVLMDEVTGIASSRDSGGMPKAVANYLVQLRRRNVALRWSAPAWGRADVIIREVSQGVTLMSAAMPKKAPPAADGTPRLWSQRRLFTARTYDPSLMEEFEAHRAEHIPHTVIAFYWGPGSLMFRAYDTLDAVSSLSTLSDAGVCFACGGKRAHHKCECEPAKHIPRPVGGAGDRAEPEPGSPRPSEPAPRSDAGPRLPVHPITSPLEGLSDYQPVAGR